MGDVYIVEACRSAIGKRGKGLAGLKPADLLGAIQKAALERSGIDPLKIDQVIGGCVSQVGEQTFNIARIAWLSQGLPMEVAATTVDSQCGSSQQATSMGASMIAAGIEEMVMSCGVEMMSRVPLGAAMKDGNPMGENYASHYQPTSQFAGAAMIAEEYQITRQDADLASLAGLKAVPGQEIHSAGTSSQVSDGAAAIILASEKAVKANNLKPRAKIVATTLVGVDPVTMLKGPIPATRKVLERAGLTVDDIDVFEVNEAFASVVLAWQKDLGVDPTKVNVNGGAIALGHPTGSTGARLITTALHELERTGGRYGLIAMCCGGGLGTGTIIERLD